MAIVILYLAAGCSTTDKLTRTPVPDEPEKVHFIEPEQEPQEKDQTVVDERARQIAHLKRRVKELELQLRKLNAKSKAEQVARESLTRRLVIAQTAREDAIREVVRVRARIQGMASQAEASAMFAEARVILDRMEEEAFSTQAAEDLYLARSYMARGKGALDGGNPGGAAYLFDLIPGIYEGMKKADPRSIKINVSAAALRQNPVKSSRRLDTLYWGETATGLAIKKEWIKVKTESGQVGWLMKSQTR